MLLAHGKLLKTKAKEINSSEKIKTFFLLTLCVFACLLLANFRWVLSLLSTMSDYFLFFSTPYFKLGFSVTLVFASVIALARFKIIIEYWFIAKIKMESEINLKLIRKAVKKAGFKRYIAIYIKLWFLKIFWACLLMLPFLLMLNVWFTSLTEASTSLIVSSAMLAGNIMLLAIATVAYLCLVQRYSLCYWILMQRDDLSSRLIIKESSKIMDKKCVDLFLFKLSFIFWFLFGIVVLPTAIYSYPYYKQACALFLLEIISTRDRCEDETIMFKSLR